MKRLALALISVLALLAAIAVAQEATLKKVPAKYAPPTNGEQVYTRYCGSCHGPDLKGNGPAAMAFKTPLPDLTTMAKRNNGEFNTQQVVQIVNGTMETPGHGSKDMPVWGTVLPTVYENKTVANMAINNLVEFIRQKQVK